jgi:hypothetical protein
MTDLLFKFRGTKLQIIDRLLAFVLIRNIVVDRHRFDADPNTHTISILMPIKIRIRIGIKTMPIHMRILILPYPMFYTCRNNKDNRLSYSQEHQITMFFRFSSEAKVS